MKRTRPVGRRTSTIPTVPQYLARRRRRRWIISLAAVGGLLVLATIDHRGWLLYPGDDWLNHHDRTFRVRRIVDGVRLEVASPDASGAGQAAVRIRLIGVQLFGDDDLAEADADDPHLVVERLAAQATALARRHCQDRDVRLLLERHAMRDDSGALLAHVQLPDGSWLADHLLLAGLVRADAAGSHQHVRRHAMVEAQARHDRRGRWTP